MGVMTCEQCRRWWSPYLDSELDATTTFQVSEHLRVCDACRDRFEREKYVDDLLREKLRATSMPGALWQSIGRQVRAERRGLPLVFKLMAPLAAAAVIALVATAGRWTGGEKQDGGGSNVRVVDQATDEPAASLAVLLQEASPTLVAFPEQSEAAEQLAKRASDLTRDLLGASFRLDPAGFAGHRITLVSADRRVDAAGKPYVEIRLNCCGKPTLLALGQASADVGIEELRQVAPRRKTDRIEVASERYGEIMLAAATADHYLTSVLASVRLDPA